MAADPFEVYVAGAGRVARVDATSYRAALGVCTSLERAHLEHSTERLLLRAAFEPARWLAYLCTHDDGRAVALLAIDLSADAAEVHLAMDVDWRSSAAGLALLDHAGQCLHNSGRSARVVARRTDYTLRMLLESARYVLEESAADSLLCTYVWSATALRTRRRRDADVGAAIPILRVASLFNTLQLAERLTFEVPDVFFCTDATLALAYTQACIYRHRAVVVLANQPSINAVLLLGDVDVAAACTYEQWAQSLLEGRISARGLLSGVDAPPPPIGYWPLALGALQAAAPAARAVVYSVDELVELLRRL